MKIEQWHSMILGNDDSLTIPEENRFYHNILSGNEFAILPLEKLDSVVKIVDARTEATEQEVINQAYLRLRFDDIDTDAVYPILNADEKEKLMKENIIFDDGMACKVIDFFLENWKYDTLSYWVIVCDLGISRSSAIADWVSKMYSLVYKDRTIYDNFLRLNAYKRRPNKLVMRLLEENTKKYNLKVINGNLVSSK